MTSESQANRLMRHVSVIAVLSIVLGGVKVSAAAPIDFDTEIMPILAKSGCNAGSCHGAAIGRGGFKLSLLGSDPVADHDTIVNQLEGRRVNLSDPDASLLLRKPSEQIGHEGGDVLPEGTDGYEQLRRWIHEGARRLGNRRLTQLTLNPESKTLKQPGESVSVRVDASFNDGPPQDVTSWTVFQASDPDSVSIQDGGRTFVVHRRGVHIVIARFLDRVMPIRLTVPMRDSAPESSSVFAEAENAIDTIIDDQLRQLKLPASPVTDDWSFIRRVSLDLTGRLPQPQQAREFAADENSGKRTALVRRLLDSNSFGEYWALKWANELGIDSKQLQPEGAQTYQRWIADRFAADAPMNETARLMLTSTGDGFVNGPVNFLRSGANPGDLAERASRAFLGVRLQCANCHDHPLDHWKQDDYHGLAALFAKVRRGRVVAIAERGEVTHPVTGQPAVPRIPGERYLETDVDGRVALADWLTSPENPYFAKATVNRIWSWLMGRGLVDPIDDLRTTNPPSHPELLEWLAQDFVDHGFRVKHTIEMICSSAAYARQSASVPGNETDVTYYSHGAKRPMEAEVIADAIADVTGVPLRLEDQTLPRAVTLTDNRMKVPSLTVLGRCDREDGCVDAAASSVSLARSLHLINGGLINDRISAPEGRLHHLLKINTDDREVLNEIFLWTLTQPSAAADDYWRHQLATIRDADAKSRARFFEDVLWSLMTSRSFVTNH